MERTLKLAALIVVLTSCTISLSGRNNWDDWPDWDSGWRDTYWRDTWRPDTGDYDTMPFFTNYIVSMGVSWGMCAPDAECKHLLTLEVAPSVRLESSSADGTRTITREGLLTDEGMQRVIEAEGALAGVELPAVTGCPGCDDGGIMELTRWRDDLGSIERVTYEQGSPPEAAILADALFNELYLAVASCESTSLVTIDAASCPVP